jgi:AcrR family transcriptional regulator
MMQNCPFGVKKIQQATPYDSAGTTEHDVKKKNEARPVGTTRRRSPARDDAASTRTPGTGTPAPEAGPGGSPPEKSESLRRRILDATLECYVKYGWSGTNMSMIARHLGMTRGMVQYYFPTLDDVLHASVQHLNSEWRKRYFSYVAQEQGRGNRLEVGVHALWRLMCDPLHTAKQELATAARSNADLRGVVLRETGLDESVTLDLAKKAYPDLAMVDETVFRRALDFTVVFMEGLSRHPFSSDAQPRSLELLDMLKGYLADYWRAHGLAIYADAPEANHAPRQVAAKEVAPAPNARRDDRDRERALSLILKAAALLSSDPDDRGS